MKRPRIERTEQHHELRDFRRDPVTSKHFFKSDVIVLAVIIKARPTHPSFIGNFNQK